jgi:hypothetical protein
VIYPAEVKTRDNSPQCRAVPSRRSARRPGGSNSEMMKHAVMLRESHIPSIGRSLSRKIRTATPSSSLFSPYEIGPRQPDGIQRPLARRLLYRGPTSPSPDEHAIVFAWISRLMAALERWLAVRPQESRSTPYEPRRSQSLDYDSYIRTNTGPDKESDARS